MSFEPISPYIAVTLCFIGQWAGNKILDAIWNKIKIHFKISLLNKLKFFELRFHSKLDEATLIIRCEAKTTKELSQIKKLMPLAIERANNWVKEHGFTHKILVYKIKNNQVSSYPELKNSLS